METTTGTAGVTTGTAGVTTGTAGVTSGTAGVTNGTAEITSGTAGVTSGTAEITSGTAGITSGTAGVTSGTAGVTTGTAGVTNGTAGVTIGTAGVTNGTAGVTNGTAGVTSGTAGVTSGTAGVTTGTAGVTNGTAGVTIGTAGVTNGTAGVTNGTAGVTSGTAGITSGTAGITSGTAYTDIHVAEISTGTLRDAIGAAENTVGISAAFTPDATTTTTIHGTVATTEFHVTLEVLGPVSGSSNIATGDRDVTGLPRTSQLISVLYEAILSHMDCIAYFLIVVNVLQNGSVFSLFYLALMFIWGLGPWPNPSWKSRAFWTALQLYAGMVITIKYAMLFWTSDSYWIGAGFGAKDGLYFPLILFGIRYDYSPLRVIVWDVVILVAIISHQTYLKVGLIHMETHHLIPILPFHPFYQLLIEPWTVERQSRHGFSYKCCVSCIAANLARLTLLLHRWELFKKSSSVSPVGKDYYTIMLCFDILTFMTIVFGASSFGVSADSACDLV